MLVFGSVALVVLLLVRRRESPSWPLLLGLAAFAVLGAYAIRGVAWWPLGAVSLVAPLIAATPSHVPGRDAPHGLARLNLAVVGILIVGCLALLPFWRPTDPGLRAPDGVVGNAPPGLTAALRSLGRP